MSDSASPGDSVRRRSPWLQNLRERGVLRVAASYAVIAWLLLQIADVILEPLGLPRWVMVALIIAAACGFPLALALAWFLEIGEQGVTVDRAATGVARPTLRGLRHYADAVVIGVLLVTVVVLAVRQSDLGRAKPPENPAIAVLPFENLSGDPEQEYFSDGLAEEMLDRLGRVPGLKVIARASSFSFKGREVDVRTVAQRLGVTTVLTGSVRRGGSRLKLNTQLIDGSSGQQIWSGSYDRELTDIFAVQSELAGAIVEAIAPAARGKVAESPPPTSDLDAYDLYLAARAQLALRSPTSLSKSVELLERAVDLDPEFARGHAALAAALLLVREYSTVKQAAQQAALLRRAESEVHRALALEPELSEAHGAYANLLRDAHRAGAEDEYRRAIELNASNAAAWHDYAVYLAGVANRPEESQRATVQSLALDPRQPIVWANYLADVVPQGRERFEAERARAVRMVGDMPGALKRFPHPFWATDRAGYREELDAALSSFRDDPVSIDEVTLPNAALQGFPVTVLEAGFLKGTPASEEALPKWINFFRAWASVDPARALSALPAHEGTHHGVDFERIRLFAVAECAGLAADWVRQDSAFATLRGRLGDDDPAVRAVMAFWLMVRGQYENAATSLALAEPIPNSRPPPMLGMDLEIGLMRPAMVRIYRETGRNAEALEVARTGLELRRAEQRARGDLCEWPQRLDYASLAAGEGLREEAVAALRRAMECGDVPYAFLPQLPWFRELAGWPAYEELLHERADRVGEVRAALERVEAANRRP